MPESLIIEVKLKEVPKPQWLQDNIRVYVDGLILDKLLKELITEPIAEKECKQISRFSILHQPIYVKDQSNDSHL